MSKSKEMGLRAEGPVRIDRDKKLVEIRTRELSSPGRSFAAQVFREFTIGSSLVLYFGQVLPPRLRLVSLIGIQLNDAAVTDFHQSLDDDFRTVVRNLLLQNPLSNEAPLDIKDDDFDRVEAARAMSVSATLGALAVNGQGAQMDWHEMAPMELVKAQNNLPIKGPAPVITIMSSVQLLARVIEAVDRVVADRRQKMAALKPSGAK